MLRADWLRTFELVASSGSFSKAARELSVSSVAVSKQIGQLEHYLGTALLQRSTRALSLTPEGELLRKQSKPLLREQQILDEWAKEHSDEPSGVLRVLCQEDSIIEETLQPTVGEFMVRYPKIELEIDIQHERIELERHPADIYWAISPYLGRNYPGLRQRRVMTDDIGVYASPEYLARYGTPETPEGIEQHQVVGYLHNNPNNALLISPEPTEPGVATRLDERIIRQLGSRLRGVSGGIDMAAQGLGLVNSHTQSPVLAKYLASGQLVPILQAYWLRDASKFAYFHQVKQEQPKVRAFLDFFTPSSRS